MRLLLTWEIASDLHSLHNLNLKHNNGKMYTLCAGHFEDKRNQPSPCSGWDSQFGELFFLFFFYVSCITEDLQKIMPVSHKQSRAFLRLVQTALSSGCGVFPRNADTARLPSWCVQTFFCWGVVKACLLYFSDNNVPPLQKGLCGCQ